jgi:tRNA pseudouridine13 synthase
MSVQHKALPAYGFSSAPYAYGEPESQVDFKTNAADFVVEEVLGFEPSGNGEHLFIQLQTDDQNTLYTQKCLAKHFSVSLRAVSYSGLKDRRGLTSQWFSLHMPGETIGPDCDALAQQGITVLRYARHHKKLRTGTHKTNRFHLILRNIQNNADIEHRLSLIDGQGVPNYFGAQRFGHHANNVAETLRWVEQGELPKEKALRGRVLSTLRAWLFNGSLAERVAADTWNQWQLNDPIVLNGSQSYFVEEQWNTQLEQRLFDGDIHIGGWLPGADQSLTASADMMPYLKLAGLKAEVRPLRLKPSALKWQEGSSKNLQISFELPKGAYATSVLRELATLNDLSGQQQK